MEEGSTLRRAPRPRSRRNLEGALWMLGSALTFTVMTILIKYLGADYPAALQTFYRQAAGLLVMLPVIARDPRGALRTTRPGILMFRSVAVIAGTILSFYAYQKLPLADANALSFTRTLWLVPLAVFVLREAVGTARIGATLVGFVGVLLMLQPSVRSGEAGPTSAALGAAVLFAATITGMKVMTRDHSVTTIMSWSALLGFVLAIPPALFVWRWPTPLDLALLCAMGVLATLNQFAYTKGIATGDTAAMAPIDYTRLIFAVALGYLLFGEIPDLLTLAGAAVIIASTLCITLLEIRVGRAELVAEEGREVA
jgi:drug/metabolite transporter (DMT)-like permease